MDINNSIAWAIVSSAKGLNLHVLFSLASIGLKQYYYSLDFVFSFYFLHYVEFPFEIQLCFQCAFIFILKIYFFFSVLVILFLDTD